MRNYFEGSYENKKIAIPIHQIQAIMERDENTTIIYVCGYATDYFVVEGIYDEVVVSIYG